MPTAQHPHNTHIRIKVMLASRPLRLITHHCEQRHCCAATLCGAELRDVDRLHDAAHSEPHRGDYAERGDGREIQCDYLPSLRKVTGGLVRHGWSASVLGGVRC